MQRLRLLVLRGDIAQRMGEAERAAALLEEAEGIRLDSDQRVLAGDALARLAELRG